MHFACPAGEPRCTNAPSPSRAERAGGPSSPPGGGRSQIWPELPRGARSAPAAARRGGSDNEAAALGGADAALGEGGGRCSAGKEEASQQPSATRARPQRRRGGAGRTTGDGARQGGRRTALDAEGGEPNDGEAGSTGREAAGWADFCLGCWRSRFLGCKPIYYAGGKSLEWVALLGSIVGDSLSDPKPLHTAGVP